MIRFTVPGEPVGKGRPRAFRMGNSIRMHTPDATARYENLVALVARQAMEGRAPMAGAVSMGLHLVTVPPASWSKRKRAAALAGAIRPTTKPDCDNVLKAIADACNGIVFIDDKQVCEVTIKKLYGETPGASVAVAEVLA
ncbi:RusA family crossover junction endodeoxyribonuclease [Azoarcus indigens]|uniref:Holliday junction resolvase RusA-like endonuclease n=1 Tax=Azoarcus indigens TaxID=29545 RepID=A0A4R6DX18_9RHOO|nr:RusA family crossover junction endodeoxyribonuclease [Azoarcus indigens]NMG64358.1 RusA family crossover junction endodeoxyribonuclease [Azoarcus indigens]TDN49189.1 Holliday junction resolvase RusA-like endonuclease [Azoarcus indigens]